MSKKAITDKQKKSRKDMKEEIEYLIECSKLPSNNDEHVPFSVIEEAIEDIPEYDMTSVVKKHMLEKLHK